MTSSTLSSHFIKCLFIKCQFIRCLLIKYQCYANRLLLGLLRRLGLLTILAFSSASFAYATDDDYLQGFLEAYEFPEGVATDTQHRQADAVYERLIEIFPFSLYDNRHPNYEDIEADLLAPDVSIEEKRAIQCVASLNSSDSISPYLRFMSYQYVTSTSPEQVTEDLRLLNMPFIDMIADDIKEDGKIDERVVQDIVNKGYKADFMKFMFSIDSFFIRDLAHMEFDDYQAQSSINFFLPNSIRSYCTDTYYPDAP